MSEDTSSEQSISKCPVDYENQSYWSLFGGKAAPVGSTKIDDDKVATTIGKPSSSSLTTNASAFGKECSSDAIPASLEEAAKHAQTPHPDQSIPLATHRSISTIPRGAISESDGTNHEGSSKTPHHQPKDSDIANWVYPSEQQVFNAMKRKGWQGVEESSIPSFLQIHNSVNERSWNQLKEWEGNNDSIRLVRFEGRPTDMTPKAWILSTLGLKSKPFDRHDWYIDNGVDHEKRYVLDFYMEESRMTGMPRVDIDVRPALDTPQAALERAQQLAQEAFPGIAKAWKDWKRKSSSQ